MMRRGIVTALGASILSTSCIPALAARDRPKHSKVRRSWPIGLSAPAPLHYRLAEITISARVGLHARVAIDGPIGADYIASAALRGPRNSRTRILVFVLDRATALMDPARIGLSIRLPRPLPAPSVYTAPEGFPSNEPAIRPALCAPGAQLEEGDLRTLSARGAALPGYSAAGAISQAYDASCSLPYQAAFEQAVEQTPVSPPPQPAPSPPVGQPPGCQPCTAPPGYACPLLARPSVCVASAAIRRRVAQPSH
jgi:hypothetical protein